MKVLLAHKFYYRRGGADIYTIDLQTELEKRGHQVAVFAMQHRKNHASPWSKYFVSEIDFNPRRPGKLIKALYRPLFSLEVYRKFTKLLKDFKPDVVHLNNIHTQISPLIARIAHKKGIKVVWTLHDHKLLCPRYDCMLHGRPCERCFKGSKWQAFKNKCIKNSLVGSLVGTLEALFWSQKRLEKYTDKFICPSKFIKAQMIKGGFNAEKLVHINNFVSVVPTEQKVAKKAQYCYVGRISPEKGVETLLEVAKDLPYPLKIMGTGPQYEVFKQKYAPYSQIEFMGFCDSATVYKTISQSKFIVQPSECYENNPLTVIESLLLNTPVLGANIGGIPELINTPEKGMLFEPWDQEDLQLKMADMMGKENQNITPPKEFTMEHYYNKLLEVYKD